MKIGFILDGPDDRITTPKIALAIIEAVNERSAYGLSTAPISEIAKYLTIYGHYHEVSEGVIPSENGVYQSDLRR